MNFDFIEDAGVRDTAEKAYEAEQTANESALDTKIQAAITGLKSKNEELIGEKRAIQDKLKDFGDLDPKKAEAALAFFDKNEKARMLADGEFEELLAKETSTIRSDFDAKLAEMESSLDTAKVEGTEYKTKFHAKMIDDSLRDVAAELGVQQSAVEDVLLKGRSLFTLAADGKSVEARDAEGKLVQSQDGIILTPTEWVKSLKTTSPHYWPPSKGAGASGTGGDPSDMMSQLVDASNRGDMKEFARIREAMKK